jgi:hypothetical protein
MFKLIIDYIAAGTIPLTLLSEPMNELESFNKYIGCNKLFALHMAEMLHSGRLTIAAYAPNLLLHSLKHNYANVVDLILSMIFEKKTLSVDVMYEKEDDHTILHYAAEGDNQDTIRKLLKLFETGELSNKELLYEPTNQGVTFFHIFCNFDKINTYKLIFRYIDEGIISEELLYMKTTDGQTILQFLYGINITTMRYVYNYLFTKDASRILYANPLIYGSILFHIDTDKFNMLFDYILEGKIDKSVLYLKKTDNEGRITTILEDAYIENHLEIYERLVKGLINGQIDKRLIYESSYTYKDTDYLRGTYTLLQIICQHYKFEDQRIYFDLIEPLIVELDDNFLQSRDYREHDFFYYYVTSGHADIEVVRKIINRIDLTGKFKFDRMSEELGELIREYRDFTLIKGT